MDVKSKILALLLFGSLATSVCLIYQNTIVAQNFEVFRPEGGIPEGIPEEESEEEVSNIDE